MISQHLSDNNFVIYSKVEKSTSLCIFELFKCFCFLNYLEEIFTLFVKNKESNKRNNFSVKEKRNKKKKKKEKKINDARHKI